MPSGRIQTTTPVTIAAAPIQIRKKPGMMISAAASSTPSDSQAQCGSSPLSQSGMSGAPLALGERVLGQFSYSPQRADPLCLLDREEDRLAVGAGRKLAHGLDIFLRDEIVDRLRISARDRVRNHLRRLGFGFSLALARLGVAERGLAPAFGLQYLPLLLAFGA